MIDNLKLYNLVYIASPYSKYPAGMEQAFIDISEITADLFRAGIKVFSPIAHSHPIAVYGGMDQVDHDLWLGLDKAFMDACGAIVVVEMDGWEESYGVNFEIEYFRRIGKPIFYYNPTLRLVRRDSI